MELTQTCVMGTYVFSTILTDFTFALYIPGENKSKKNEFAVNDNKNNEQRGQENAVNLSKALVFYCLSIHSKALMK